MKNTDVNTNPILGSIDPEPLRTGICWKTTPKTYTQDFHNLIQAIKNSKDNTQQEY